MKSIVFENLEGHEAVIDFPFPTRLSISNAKFDLEMMLKEERDSLDALRMRVEERRVLIEELIRRADAALARIAGQPLLLKE